MLNVLINMNFFLVFITVYFPLLFLLRCSVCYQKPNIFPWWPSYSNSQKQTFRLGYYYYYCQQRQRPRQILPRKARNYEGHKFCSRSTCYDEQGQKRRKLLKSNKVRKKDLYTSEISSHRVECEDMIGSDVHHSSSDNRQPSSVPPSSPLTGSDDGSLNDETKKETITFPKTLEEFKYEFNEEGQLRHIETNKPFEFNISDEAAYNQQHYEALGDVITEYVYDLLEKAGLERVYIPTDHNNSEPQSFVFRTKDALENEDKLLLLVHGSGVVKAGQWARRLIINDCLDSGSQLPFIKRAIDEGYGVLVLNTNLNSVDGQKIRENSTPTQHMFYVWRNFVHKAQAKHVAFVSHSYGGVVTVKAASENRDFQSRVFAVAFTDSIHSDYVTDDLEKFFQEKSRNWVSSDEPLDTEIPCHFCSTPKVSAGHSQHEMTSYSSMNSIFDFLKQKYEEASKSQSI